MAKRRKRRDDSPPRRPQGPPPLPPGVADLLRMGVDPEELLRVLQGGGPDRSTPQGKALDLVNQAHQAMDGRRRISLIRQALETDPDCVEAYRFLAETTRNRTVALGHYREAVAAAVRMMGAGAFEEHAGHFWEVPQTRPYLAALRDLTGALWLATEREESIRNLWEMLRLNPGDNLGARTILASHLLFLDRDADLERLLELYPSDESATWAWTRALAAFRKERDTPATRRLLELARKANRHVPEYLLGRKHPDEQPDHYSPGSDEEAQYYLNYFLAAWKDSPGAIDWVRATDLKTQKRKAKEPQARGPLAMVKHWLNDKLRQGEDIWQADTRPTANPIKLGGERTRPWVTLVMNATTDMILGNTVHGAEPSEAEVWDGLLQALQRPMKGKPQRPAEIQTRAGSLVERLRPHLEEVGVRVRVVDELEPLWGVMADLSEEISGPPTAGLLDSPGVTPEQAAGYFAAAASFYRAKPWKVIGCEAPLKVECDRFTSGPWYAVIMGIKGLSRGLALYDNLGVLTGMWEEPADRDEHARRSTALSVLFDDLVDMPLSDLEGISRYGWEIAGPDAYPWALFKELGLTHRPPLKWELELLEGALRVIPGFVERHKQTDPTAETLTVSVTGQEMRLVLAWLPDEGE